MDIANTNSSATRVMIQAFHLTRNDARLAKLRASFAGAGFEVAACCPRLGDYDVAEGVTLAEPGAFERVFSAWVKLPLLGRLLAAFIARKRARAMAGIAEDFAPDVLVVFDPEALPAALLSKTRTGARLVFDAHEYHVAEAPDQPERGLWVERMEAKAGPHVDALLTVNQSIADLYWRDQRYRTRAMVVRNTVDPAPLGQERPLREALGENAKKRILLYHGAMRSLRGLKRLLELSGELTANWHLVFMGDGPIKAELLAEADPRRVSFLPPVPHADLPQWIAGADLGAVLYEDSGENQRFCLPNKVWEYASVGVPMLASDLPEIARAVGASGAGWLVDNDAPTSDLAELVSALDDEALTRARQAACRLHEENLWSDEVRPLLDLIAPNHARYEAGD